MNADKTDRKVIVIGGGYSGGLSAWFREKYPHLAIASWSSSGAVYPKENLVELDKKVYEIVKRIDDDIGTCVETISQLNKKVDSTFKSAVIEDIQNMMDAMGTTM